MNYNKLTKAQLIARIEELETQTVEYKLNQAKEEIQALGRDLVWTANRTYALGQQASAQVRKALTNLEKRGPILPVINEPKKLSASISIISEA